MKIIGLTGGSGAGKSVAAEQFQKLGAGIVDADAVYRELCNNNMDMLNNLKSEFGDILTEDNKLDRTKLAKIVFSDSKKLARLNEITFPYIKKTSDEKFEIFRKQGCLIALYDAPTLFQNGADSICDSVIGVIAKRETRIKRILQRDGISEQAAASRIDSQPNDEFYYTHCNYILENDVSRETFESEVKQLWKKLLE